jgi:hypothetical protein
MNLRISVTGVLLSFILALAMLIPHAEAQDEIENLIQNTDFMESTAGWSIGAGGNDGAGGVLSIDRKEEPIGEGNCLLAQIDALGAGGGPEIHSPAFDVELGETYTVSFWAKTEEGEIMPIAVKFEQLDTWTGPSQNFTINEEMTEYHFSPNMTVDSPPQVVIHIRINTLGIIWFSHFRVYEGEYEEEDLEGRPKIAVTPMARLATRWGEIKAD